MFRAALFVLALAAIPVCAQLPQCTLACLPQVTLAYQVPKKTVTPCRCSAQCTCGCNQGGACDCNNPVPQPLRHPAPVHDGYKEGVTPQGGTYYFPWNVARPSGGGFRGGRGGGC